MGFHRDSGPFSCGTSSTLVTISLLTRRRLQEGCRKERGSLTMESPLELLGHLASRISQHHTAFRVGISFT
jgi:hypothetical protein